MNNLLTVNEPKEILINVPKYSILSLNDGKGNEVLRFETNGDIYLHDKLIENDKQVVDGFREFLRKQGFAENF